MQDFPIITVEPLPFAYLHRTASLETIGAAMSECFELFGSIFAQTGIVPSGPPLANYLGLENGSTTFDVGFPVREADTSALKAAGLSIGVTPSGRAMKALHTGPYDSVPRTYAAMQAAMAEKKLIPGQSMWEVYLSPPHTPPEKTLTEVYWPVSD